MLPLPPAVGCARASSSTAQPEAPGHGLCINPTHPLIHVPRTHQIAIAPGGGLRSRVFLNGAASSLRVLRELGQLLVDSNGQHSALALRDPETQVGACVLARWTDVC